MGPKCKPKHCGYYAASFRTGVKRPLLHPTLQPMSAFGCKADLRPDARIRALAQKLPNAFQNLIPEG